MIAAAGMIVGITIGSIAPSLIGRVTILLLMGVLWPVGWAGKGIQIIRSANALQEPRLHQASGPVHIRHHGEDEYTV